MSPTDLAVQQGESTSRRQRVVNDFTIQVATVNGSGTIQNLKGTTTSLNLQVNGNGEINIPDLTGKTVETSITGSGKICTGATESLHAEIAGSGDVRYAGSPLKKNVEIVGTGTVTAMN